MRLLRTLSRNAVEGDGFKYLDGIIEDEDALIVKLADRVANMKDLLCWIKKEGGFNKESRKIAKKYIGETEYMLTGLRQRYPGLITGSKKHPFSFQAEMLKNLLEELKRFYNNKVNRS